MNELNLEEFSKFIKEFIPDSRETLEEECLNDSVDDIKDILNSTEAKMFTVRINKMFEEKGLKDTDGNPITVEDPGPNIGKEFNLTEEQDRWFRSYELYELHGRNLLKKLGFKYTDR